ncbi:MULTISPECIES: helix-turn-helix domain-containing protein [unclassified Duganella]|uniref:AraC family transcriptional regulator n=1 Tax=unclassified Duganella TaxID=2636909 RepID=UPI000E344F13|nr:MULTISPECIES: helix-turn-helix domain-containing protein [unclassified Duganella]RFP12795.1 AraC family transcriptional regulator [Duganella sp. BJB475]RFP28804.1 AraC family transcriptional regulator [Duganella sp. BJB476]
MQTVTSRPKGVVNPAAAEKIFRLERYLPTPDLAPFVEYFWLVAWQLPEGVVHVQRTLPSPCIHLVFDAGRTAVFGVMTGAFEYTLKNSGRILGVRFLPGAFRSFLKQPVQSVTDRELPLSALFDCDDAEAERSVLTAADAAGMVEAASAILRRALPVPDPQTARIAEILDAIAHHPEITQVQQLADHTGISVRRLQILFKEYVGATPKWVIRRNRLLDAADQLSHGSEIDLASLAQALGYYDQAHFTTDFEKLVGKPPADYRRSCKEQA